MSDHLEHSGHDVHGQSREPLPRATPRSSSRAVSCALVAGALLAACAQAPGESTTSSNVITLDHLFPNRILDFRDTVSSIVAAPLADDQLRFSAGASQLLATPESMDLLTVIVSCAMPPDVALIATIDNTEVDFPGEIGIAPEWQSGPLSLEGQRWLSACIFARVNRNFVAIPISMRGPNPVLAVEYEEREIWPLEEGAFYGNMFVSPDQPLQWFACRGRDQLPQPTGVLADRNCATPDPANPGFTQCGFVFTGDCGSFADDQACEAFSSNGTFYKRCHTAPIQNGAGSEVFEQVITTFTTT